MQTRLNYHENDNARDAGTIKDYEKAFAFTLAACIPSVTQFVLRQDN